MTHHQLFQSSASTTHTSASPTSRIGVEYQGIILAVGQGSRIYPLASTDPSHGLPKSLLPVVNRPVIRYALDLYQSCGFSEVMIVCRQSQQSQLNEYINYIHDSNRINESIYYSIDIKLLVVDDNISGTADALREISSYIYTNFFVLTADCISNIQLQNLADIHRTYNSAMVALCTYPYESRTLLSGTSGSGGGGGGKKKSSRQPTATRADTDDADSTFIGLDSSSNTASYIDGTSRLLLYRATADIDECLDVNKKLLRQHPHITLYTQLRDQHCYLFSHWIIELLHDRLSIESIENDLIPYLVRSQYKENLRVWKEKAKKQSKLYEQPLYMSHSRESLIQYDKHSDENYSCYVYIPSTPSSHITLRACNNIRNYMIANFDLAMDPEFTFTPWLTTQQANNNYIEQVRRNNPNAKIQSQCVIGEHTTVGDQSVLKRCIIGNRCKIGNHCKLNNVILMDDVTIEDYVKLDDCIVAVHARIGKSSTLKDVKIGAGYVVEPNTELKNELLSKEDEEGEIL